MLDSALPWGVFVTNALFSVAVAWALLSIMRNLLTTQGKNSREDSAATRQTIDRNTEALTELRIASGVQTEALKNMIQFQSRAQTESVRHHATVEAKLDATPRDATGEIPRGGLIG